MRFEFHPKALAEYEDVNFSVTHGEIVGVLGTNRAGKTEN